MMMKISQGFKIWYLPTVMYTQKDKNVIKTLCEKRLCGHDWWLL